MSDLYRTPMNGIIPISWSLGTDEEGAAEGFVGIPKTEEDIDEVLRDCAGSEITFACDMQAIDDESMAISIRAACMHAVGKYVMPQLISQMYNAAIELRERAGGFDQSKYDHRLQEIRRQMEEDSADEVE